MGERVPAPAHTRTNNIAAVTGDTSGSALKTLNHAVLGELRPHLDWPLSREVWNMAFVQQ